MIKWVTKSATRNPPARRKREGNVSELNKNMDSRAHHRAPEWLTVKNPKRDSDDSGKRQGLRTTARKSGCDRRKVQGRR